MTAGAYSIRERRDRRVDDDDLRRLAAAGREADVAAGQLLIERGHPGAGLYVVLEGSIVVEAHDRRCELGAGACIGELALLTPNGRHTARVRARTDLRVLAVARAEFERLCDADQGLRHRFGEAARVAPDR